MTARTTRPGPGFEVHRELDGGWACRAWNGRGQVVEVHQRGTREQAVRQAAYELEQLIAARATS